MATVQRFEEIQAWKAARALTCRVYAATASGSASKDFAFRDQIRRAAMSVMLNIAEGFEREDGDKAFSHFLSIAKGSAGEVRAALYVGFDCGYLTETDFRDIEAVALDCSRLLSGFIKYLRSKGE